MPDKSKLHFAKLFKSKPRQFWKRAHRGAKELIIDPESPQAVRTGKARKQWISNLQELRISSYHTSICIWVPELHLVQVMTYRLKSLQSMGFSYQRSTYLFPEEALWLMERSQLVIYHNKLPMTIQQMYSFMLKSGLSINAYLTYAYLKRYDYIVLRSGSSFNSFNLDFFQRLSVLFNYIPGPRDQWHPKNYHPWKVLEPEIPFKPTPAFTPFGQPIPQDYISPVSFSMDYDSDEDVEPLFTMEQMNSMSKEAILESISFVEETRLIDLCLEHHPIPKIEECVERFNKHVKVHRNPKNLHSKLSEPFSIDGSHIPLPDPSTFHFDPQTAHTFPFLQSVEGKPLELPTTRPSLYEDRPKIVWDVYAPSTSFQVQFKKTRPGPPSFRLAITPYRGEFPSLAQIAEITYASFPIPVRFCVYDSGNLIHFDLVDGGLEKIGTNPWILNARGRAFAIQQQKEQHPQQSAADYKTSSPLTASSEVLSLFGSNTSHKSKSKSSTDSTGFKSQNQIESLSSASMKIETNSQSQSGTSTPQFSMVENATNSTNPSAQVSDADGSEDEADYF